MMSYLLYVCCGGLMVSMAVADTAESTAESGSTLTFVPKYCKMLDYKGLEEIKASPSVGTVFFYKKSAGNWTKDFLNKYDKSAGFLNAYGLPLGLVDCSGDLPQNLDNECATVNADIVYTYKDGQLLLELDLSTVFDVDSIMSNILLLALVEEVSIVQTKASRQELEHENAGQKPVVLAYHAFIGSYENRVFMEIAYAYQDKYKFAITSEIPPTAGLQDADQLVPDDPQNPISLIWVLYCHERYSLETGCRSVNYRGLLNLIDMAQYFQRLDWPRVVHRKKGGEETHPCETSTEVGCMIITYCPGTKEEAEPLIDSLQFDIHGLVGLIVEYLEDATEKTFQVTLQKVGGQTVTLEGSIGLNKIEEAISVHLLPGPDSEPEEGSTEEEERPSDPTQIDDMVVQLAYTNRNAINDVPLLPALTDKTFPSTIKGNKLTVVLFFLPFDADGVVFLKPFEEAAKRLAALKGDDPSDHPLARVNCFDWTDVCQKENITTYPVIYIYRKGEKRQQYRHALDTDVVVRSVKFLQAEQPLMLTTEEQVDRFLSYQLPSEAYKDVENLVLLTLSRSLEEMEMYKAVVKALETQMLFAIVDPDVTDLVPNGAVLHRRTKDTIQPVEIMTEPQDTASIVEFLLKRQFALFPELTFLNFPALYAKKKPFAILFYEPSVPSANEMHQVIANHLLSGKVEDMVFCKMTVGDANPEAKPLLMNYTQAEDVPAFTIVNHQKGQVFVLQDKEMKGSALLPWIQAVQDGEVIPTKILDKGEWKAPGKHFDFLALMDKDKKRKQQAHKKEMVHRKEDTGASETQSEEPPADEAQDVEARNALLELQRSRLYSGRDRKVNAAAAGKEKAAKGGAKTTGKDKTGHEHSEL